MRKLRQQKQKELRRLCSAWWDEHLKRLHEDSERSLHGVSVGRFLACAGRLTLALNFNKFILDL